MASKKNNTSSMHGQITKAATQTFIAVAIASVVVSMSLVLLNILWGTAKYNSRVQGQQEETRKVLQSNVEAAPELEKSFRNLEIGDNLLTGQPDDKKNSEVILDALPSKFDFPALATSIDALAARSSVELDTFSGVDLGSGATQSSASPEPEVIPFNVEVKGSYASITKFLKGLEDSIRPISVVSIKLSGTDSNLTASIKAETNYQPAFDLTIQKEVVE